MAALDDVPDEITETILLKLPIKSLLTFKTVSKSWNSIISNLRFIRTHHQLSMNSADSDNLFLHNHNCGCCFSLVRFEGHQFKFEPPVWRPLALRSNTFMCIGDGLVLLQSNKFSNSKRYMLWNPRTRQDTIIFRFPYYVGDFMSMYGVCYDPVNEDVKIVIASIHFYTVYSCNNRSWAEEKKFPYQIGYQTFDGGLSVDGAIYWICDEKYRSSRIILLFDSKDDSFDILQKPGNLEDEQLLGLKARKGRLYLCCYGRDERTVEIWIKEKWECSWKVLVNIDNLDTARIQSIVVATENKMIIQLGWGRYCIYNCHDKSYREFVVNLNLRQFRLHPFVDSMFFPVMKRERKRKREAHDMINYKSRDAQGSEVVYPCLGTMVFPVMKN